MIRDSGGNIRGVSFVYPTGVGGPQWADPGPVFHGEQQPGGPNSHDPVAIGDTAIGGPVPWQGGESDLPPAATNPSDQQWVRPDVWHAGTPTGTETPATSSPEEQAPLADMEVNPGQRPFAERGVLPKPVLEPSSPTGWQRW